MTQALLTVDSLSIAFDPDNPVVKNLSFSLNQGESLALVGQSGSGKTLTALSVPQLLPRHARVCEKSRILFEGQDLLSQSEERLGRLRGSQIGMIFQDAMSSFNPVKTIGNQLIEMSRLHSRKGRATRKIDTIDALDKVGLLDPERVFHSYPHELSGGMRQRAMIAMALLHKPKLLIADEPTTALDVTVQKQVLALLKSLQAEHGFSILFITHDLSVVSQIADHIVVLKEGVCLESSPADEFFKQPKSDYALELRRAVLPLTPATPRDIQTPSVLDVDNLCVSYAQARRGLRRPAPLAVVKHAHLSIHQGQTLALIGESGSGKTTLAKTIVKLIEPTSGHIKLYADKTGYIEPQMIFQDPYSAFNPRRSVADSIIEALKKYNTSLTRQAAIEETKQLLKRVSINPRRCWDFPHEFSGGQRQRIAIARALAAKPTLLILDEPTSALDVSSQQEILTLLDDLQREHNVAFLLITHHMGIVAKIADTVAVMKNGDIVEQGTTEDVLTKPQHSYTRALLGAVLELRQPNDQTSSHK